MIDWEQMRTVNSLRYVYTFVNSAIEIIDELDTLEHNCAKNGYFLHSRKKKKRRENARPIF
jgi:hypothetical protein